MDDRFFTACFPGEVRACGRDLKIFSAYHVLLLRAIGSPFARSDGEIRPADLLAAVCACRHRFGEPVDMRPRLRDAVWKWRMDRKPGLFRRECEAFSRWVAEHSNTPRFWTVISGGEKTRDLTGPDILTLVVPVMMRMGLSEDAVWNMSYGRLHWYHAEVQEIEGSSRRFLWEDDLEDEPGKEAANA